MSHKKLPANQITKRLDIHAGQLIYSRTYGACVYRRSIKADGASANDPAENVEIQDIFSTQGLNHFITGPRIDIMHIPKRETVLRAIEKLQGKMDETEVAPNKERLAIFRSGDLVEIAGQVRALYRWIREKGLTVPSSGQAPEDFRKGLHLLGTTVTMAGKRAGVNRQPSALLPFLKKTETRLTAILVGHLKDLKPEVFLSFELKTDGLIAEQKALAATNRTTPIANGGEKKTARPIETTASPIETTAAPETLTPVQDATVIPVPPPEEISTNGHNQANSHDQTATPTLGVQPKAPQSKVPWYGRYPGSRFVKDPR